MDVVVVAVGEKRYGLPAEDVRSFARLDALAPLPGAPAHVDGTATVGGTRLPVLDLRAVVGLPSRPPALGDALVVARVGGRRAALRVDAPLGFASFDDHVEATTPVLHDLDHLLSASDARRLDDAMRTGGSDRTIGSRPSTSPSVFHRALALLRPLRPLRPQLTGSR